MNSTPERQFAATIAAPQAGQVVGERYRLEEWLESGAMGSVWRAEQIRLRSAAAVKFLDPSLIEVPEMLERFLQEARSAAAVQSAHVIQVFDYGSEGGLPYIAMEFLEGENLAARLARCRLLSPAELDKIFGEVARGLGQAHEQGVIHRDVKPANIFLAREGRHEVTKLIDFGIAKVKADALRVSQVVGTQLGTLLGTPQYMSPEQLRGRGTLDYRTDLWALAIIACECLTGRQAFSGATIGDLTVQICMEDPLAPSTLGDVPEGFDRWFFKATSKEPSERFESAADMADALRRILVRSQRAPSSIRSSPRLVLSSSREVSAAWSAMFWSTSRQVIAESVVGVVRSLRRPKPPSLWLRTGALALALMVVAGGLLLLRRPRASSAPTVHTSVASRALSQPISRSAEGVVPVSPTPAVRSPPLALARDPVKPAALPVLEPDDSSLRPTAEARSVPSSAPKARRRTRRQTHPSTSNSSTHAPMSEAMRRLGALLAQGGDKRLPARSGKSAPDQARDRASSTSARSSSLPAAVP